MEQNPTPTRRWLRFSLRTMLVLVTLACIYLGWLMNWKKQREAILIRSVELWNMPSPHRPLVVYGGQSPLLLRFFGVRGVSKLDLHMSATDEELKRVRALFPEANVDRPELVEFYGS